MVSPDQVARDVTEVGLMRMVATMAVVLPSAALIQVLANARDYRQPALAIAAWLAVLGAAAWLVPRARAGRLAGGETAAAIAIAVAAVAVIGLSRPARGVPENADLAIMGTVWLLVLVVINRPAWIWVPGALLVLAVHGALLLRDGGLTPLSLSQLEAGGYIISMVLIAFAALRPAMEIHASLAARRASLASRLAAKRAAADAIGQERRNRLAVLEEEALPLLRGIADGTLDPTAPAVRDRCARHAAVLRHSLAGGARPAGPLAARLEPALRAARERGLLVTVQRIGDPGTPPPGIAGAVAATVEAVLCALPPHQVTLTLLAGGDTVELYLTFAAPLPIPPDLARFGRDVPAAVRWQAAVTAAEAGIGCLEISWARDGAA